MYERLDNCPLCNSGHFHNKIITKDHTVSGESFAIVECDKCKLNYTNPRPSINEIDSFYKSDDYISHSNQSKSLFDLIYRSVRYYTLRSKLRLINSLDTKKTLLDYGCGTGNFLNLCKNADWQVTGFEPNRTAREIAARLTNENILNSTEEIPSGQQYHIITLWHVLEHIHDLQGTMKLLTSKVKKKGFLVIALPNINSWDAQHYKEHWAGYDVPRHLYHFNPETFKTLAESNNLKISKIIPMKFDSFYISLLSEKYKYNRNNLYRAIINGFKSNKNARRSNQYSSLIYILRR